MTMQGDPLTEVFDALRLSGGLYFTADLGGEFAVAVPEDRNTVRFHGVLSGTCGVKVPGFPSESLSAGDWGIIPHGATQTLFRGDRSNPIPLPSAMAAGTMTSGGRFLLGTDGPRTEMLCGFCEFRSGFTHPLLWQLPPMVILRRSEIRDNESLSAVSAILTAEGAGGYPGKSVLLTRAIEILFLLVVRRCTGSPPGASTGFVSVLADARLSRPLRAIHRNPAARWTLAEMARSAGMSRSAFADAFKEKTGMAPVAYLRMWRMVRARELLRGTDLDIAEIAARCGYDSLPSFSIRFKKETGMGPGTYRRTARG